MDNWTISTERPGYRCKTVQRGPATIVIYRPIHNAAEAAKAEQATRTALENALSCIYTDRAREVRRNAV